MDEKINEAVRRAAARINEFSRQTTLFSGTDGELPDRACIIEITEQLRGLMFPGYFCVDSLSSNEFGCGSALSSIVRNLEHQALLVLKGDTERVNSILTAFVEALPGVQEILTTDVEALFNGDPAASSKTDVVFSYPGLLAITVYRLAHVLYLLELPLIPRMMTEYAHSLTGIDINAGATIGKYFFIDHGTGVVIGETTVIGDNVKLYQGVTLGALSTRQGQLLSGVKRHPTLGNRVTVYSGASILGGETVIGDDCLIGGNTFITSSVPAGTRVSIKPPELNYR